jgi:hypothetical protein
MVPVPFSRNDSDRPNGDRTWGFLMNARDTRRLLGSLGVGAVVLGLMAPGLTRASGPVALLTVTAIGGAALAVGLCRPAPGGVALGELEMSSAICANVPCPANGGWAALGFPCVGYGRPLKGRGLVDVGGAAVCQACATVAGLRDRRPFPAGRGAGR